MKSRVKSLEVIVVVGDVVADEDVAVVVADVVANEEVVVAVVADVMADERLLLPTLSSTLTPTRICCRRRGVVFVDVVADAKVCRRRIRRREVVVVPT